MLIELEKIQKDQSTPDYITVLDLVQHGLDNTLNKLRGRLDRICQQFLSSAADLPFTTQLDELASISFFTKDQNEQIRSAAEKLAIASVSDSAEKLATEAFTLGQKAIEILDSFIDDEPDYY